MSDATEPPPKPRLFVSYAHADETDGGWKTKLLPTLQALRNGGVIEFFEDRMIAVGDEWDERLRRELDEFDLIIFLVSAGFLGSGYIETVEVKRAMERHTARDAHVLPILVRHCDWTYRNWAKIQTFPRHGPDVLELAEWEKRGDLDKALTQISIEIRGWAAGWKPRDRTPSDTAALPSTPPYRGLLPFQQEHKDDYFGRDDLLETLRATVRDNRLTLLRGGSGSGKSSLVNAGLVPSLKAEDRWRIARLRPGATPIVNLANALARAMLPGSDAITITDRAEDLAAKLAQDPARLLKYAATHHDLSGKALFLVVDQLEETFNLALPANPDQHRQLMAMLRSLADAAGEPVVKALLAMRADFQAELQNEDPALVKALDRATVSMTRMTDAELALSIEAPARRRGVAVEPALLARIVNDVGRNPDALPLVEVTLEALWAGRATDTLTLDAYEKQGGLTGALAGRGEAALADPTIDEATARRLFLELVHVDAKGGIDNVTRQPRSRAHLDSLDPALWELGRALASEQRRLLVTSRDDATGSETLDIIHEALFRQWPRLASWIEDERDFLLFAQRLDQRLAEFTASEENPDYLLPRTDVETAERWQNEHGKTFRVDQQAYIAKSAAFWAADAADDEARALWARLELFEDRRGISEHDRLALAGLSAAEAGTIQRFLALATLDRDSVRKFRRAPTLVLRASLGLNPPIAIDRALPTLTNERHGTAFDTAFALISVACSVAPLLPDEAAHCVARTVEQAEHTNDPFDLQDLAYAIATLAGRFDLATARSLARRTMYRATHLAGLWSDLEDIRRLAESVALVSELDVKAAQEAAGYIIGRTLDVTEDTINVDRLMMLPEIISTIAGHLDEETASRVVARSLDLVAETKDTSVLKLLAQSIAKLADKPDPATVRGSAVHIVERAIQLAENPLAPKELQNAAEAVAVLAGKIDPTTLRIAAERVIGQALDLAEHTTNPYHLDTLAKAISALIMWQDAERATHIASRIVVRVLAASPDTLLAPAEPASAIAAVVQYLDANYCTHTIELLLESIEKQHESFTLSSKLRTITVLSSQSNKDSSAINILRLLDLTENNASPQEIPDIAEAIASLSIQIEPPDARHAARLIVERAAPILDIISDQRAISYLLRTIVALAGHLDTAAIRAAATRTVDCALDLAAETTDPDQLQAMAQAIAALAPHLPGPATALTAIELLKSPLGGDEAVTDTLVTAIATVLDRPDLLRPFPEQSFWAVMQHLAELKVAHPDWDWLDLARPPLPKDELVATFRRLCADPPDWPARSAPS